MTPRMVPRVVAAASSRRPREQDAPATTNRIEPSFPPGYNAVPPLSSRRRASP